MRLVSRRCAPSGRGVLIFAFRDGVVSCCFAELISLCSNEGLAFILELSGLALSRSALISAVSAFAEVGTDERSCRCPGDGTLAKVISEGLAVTSGSEGTKVRAAIESSGARPTSHRAIPLPATAPTAAAINKERSVRTKVRVDAR